MSARRRDFIIGAAVAAVLPRAARLEPRVPARRIGMLLLFAESDPEAQVRVKAFGQGLRALDWREGDNVNIEYRFAAGDFDRMRAFAKELVELKPDVIITNSIQPIIPVWQQTRIPFIFAMAVDPVVVGLIKSLSHPDQTMTGFTTFEYAIVGKWLELLKAIAPRVKRVGIILNPDAWDRTLSPPRGDWKEWLHQAEAFAPSFAVEAIPVPVQQPNKFELVINLKTERPLQLKVQRQVLVRTDEVRERKGGISLGCWAARPLRGRSSRARNSPRSQRLVFCVLGLRNEMWIL